MNREQVISLIRDIPDFPKPGIIFKDITPLLADPAGFAEVTRSLAEAIEPYKPDAIVGIDARGFIFGTALAQHLSLPLQLVRKKGKLPYKTISEEYELEYGTDTIEMHEDAITPGRGYAVIDDLIATGGTAGATHRLITRQGGTVCCAAFVIELTFLAGREKLGDCPVESLLTF